MRNIDEDRHKLGKFMDAVLSLVELGRHYEWQEEVELREATSGGNVASQADVIELEQTALRERQRLCPELVKNENYWKVTLALALAEAREETPQVKTVALDVDLPQTTILRTLQAMEEDGLIERVKKHDDQRVTLLKLTETSRNALIRWVTFKGSNLRGLGVIQEDPLSSGSS